MGILKRLFTPRRPPKVTKVPTPPDAVPRDPASLLQKRGWGRTGNDHYAGHFATRFGTWPGRIERAGDTFRVFIKNPPDVVAKHPKWACFSRQHNGWWKINIYTNPVDRDPNAVAYYIERVLAEAFKMAGKT